MLKYFSVNKKAWNLKYNYYIKNITNEMLVISYLVLTIISIFIGKYRNSCKATICYSYEITSETGYDTVLLFI